MGLNGARAVRRYDEVVAAGGRLLVALDFDGTLSPIVADPTRAYAHPDATGVLSELARQVRAVAVVTGRPAGQVLELGRLEQVADRLGGGGELLVLGQYGTERWSSADRQTHSPEPPPGLARLRDELPALLTAAGCADAWVEDKRLALAVHTRRLADPEVAYGRLLPALTEAAERHGLAVEPGRMVIELRGPGMDKGRALHRLVDELAPRAVLFAGDDLGDVAAFRAVQELRASGLPGLLVCSGSEEQTALADLADVVVDGPDGTLAFLARLARDLPGAG